MINKNMSALEFDAVGMYMSCYIKSQSEEEAKLQFCNKLLKEFMNFTGEQLAHYLSSITFDRSTLQTTVTLVF